MAKRGAVDRLPPPPPIPSNDDLDDPGAGVDELSAEDAAIIAAIQSEDAEAAATRAARRKQLMQVL
eukprot:4586042-Pleurochrysis_carterae.AAC.2